MSYTTPHDVRVFGATTILILFFVWLLQELVATMLLHATVVIFLVNAVGYLWRHRSLLVGNTGAPSSSQMLGFPLPKKAEKALKKFVLITGGAHGIGKGVAGRFLKMGYDVYVWDINGENMRKFEQEYKEACVGNGGSSNHSNLNGKLTCQMCNVADEDDVNKKAQDLLRQLRSERPSDPSLDVLVLNAGIVNGTNVIDSQPSALKRIFGVNVMHLFNISREFLPGFAQAGKDIQKSIVVVGSIAGYCGAAQLADYTGTKGAANLFAESLAAECRLNMAQSNLRISLICPNVVDTGMFDGCKAMRFFTMLKEERVVSEIIDAIRFKKQLVVIPYVLHFLYAAKAVLPYFVIYPYVDDFLGASTAMREFVPRVHCKNIAGKDRKDE